MNINDIESRLAAKAEREVRREVKAAVQEFATALRQALGETVRAEIVDAGGESFRVRFVFYGDPPATAEHVEQTRALVRALVYDPREVKDGAVFPSQQVRLDNAVRLRTDKLRSLLLETVDAVVAAETTAATKEDGNEE